MTNEAKELLKDKPELCKELFYELKEMYLVKDLSFNACIERMFEHTAKDWEILSRIFTEDGNEIHSVRRLSDNEVFTGKEETMQGKIKRFGIVGNDMMVECESKFAECDLNINDLIKRSPLFTTEDGKEVFEGEEYCWVNESDYDNIRKSTAHKETEISGFATFLFSTRQAAEQWVEDNKPVFSKSQIKELKDTLYKFLNR